MTTQVSKVCVCTSRRETLVTYKSGERRGEVRRRRTSGLQAVLAPVRWIETDQHWNTDGENFRVTRTCKNVDFSREELLQGEGVESSKT